ncbi:MAG: PD40 domain-containing protein [Bacteroidaceae bacterium]|nr:PD40 domain-containing protein [Bacteroidaceae bacterium]
MRTVFSSITFFLLAASLLLSACSSKPSSVPQQFTEVGEAAPIYPDYRDVTIPPNIAPLNFMVTDSLADAYVMQAGDLVCGAGRDGKFDMDSTVWRRILSGARGRELAVNVFARRADGWVRFAPFTLHVAEEDIDPYLTYRLIEPGYELYFQLGIYQRNLTNFDVTTVYENDRRNGGNSHCINCHMFQNYSTERMILHVRENNKGTVVTHGTEAFKMIIAHDSIIASGAYGGWHPTLPLLAFSSNKTAQVFHYHYPEKIEVYDGESDIILYDAERNEVRNILRTPDFFETFPSWSPDGTRLYYCSARLPKFEYTNFEASLVTRFDSLFYDLYSVPFDTVTYTFGEPRLEVEASAIQHSCSTPRVSPDGRYLLFAYAKYGQFHLYHKDADLWVKPLEVESSKFLKGQASQSAERKVESSPSYPLTATNSPDVESYHAWSSNGRWIVFSSRRDDGDFTRTYIAYFDRQGQGHRAFLLPQRDPEYNLLLLKSYNCAELTRDAVRLSEEQFNHVICHTEAQLATYRE